MISCRLLMQVRFAAVQQQSCAGRCVCMQIIHMALCSKQHASTFPVVWDLPAEAIKLQSVIYLSDEGSNHTFMLLLLSIINLLLLAVVAFHARQRFASI